jgi:hypothetical protein
VSQPDTRRNTRLFLQHLDDLRRALRGYRKIHVICDNAPFHTSAAVRQYLVKWRHLIQLRFLPKYRAGDQSHRARLVALPRDHHLQLRQSGRFYFAMKAVFPLAP